MQTVQVSPIDLEIGDKVIYHGAIVEVMHIIENECSIPGGIRVAACISRVVGDQTGIMPIGWFETQKSMIDRGCGDYAKTLPEDGLYTNVQGNALASVSKLIDNINNIK